MWNSVTLYNKGPDWLGYVGLPFTWYNERETANGISEGIDRAR